jgi:preprotein translocase subunit SecG
MAFIIVLLTLAMVLNSVILIFLVLIQLPKKEAGGVLAFGASGADALFGAGSGTMLTKITKYAATAFFILAIVLSLLQSAYHNRRSSTFEKNIGKTTQTAPAALPPARTPATPPPSSTPGTISGTSAIPFTIATNPAPSLAPAPESTNVPPATNAVPAPK